MEEGAGLGISLLADRYDDINQQGEKLPFFSC